MRVNSHHFSAPGRAANNTANRNRNSGGGTHIEAGNKRCQASLSIPIFAWLSPISCKTRYLSFAEPLQADRQRVPGVNPLDQGFGYVDAINQQRLAAGGEQIARTLINTSKTMLLLIEQDRLSECG